MPFVTSRMGASTSIASGRWSDRRAASPICDKITRVGRRFRADKRVINLRDAAQRSIADGRITPEESDDICGWITHLVGDSASDTGVATFGNVGVIEGALEDHNDIIFEERMFVLTGKFTLGPRKAIQGMISDRGGQFKNNVCKNTHYLCVATEASRDWRHTLASHFAVRAVRLRLRFPEWVG